MSHRTALSAIPSELHHADLAAPQRARLELLSRVVERELRRPVRRAVVDDEDLVVLLVFPAGC